MSDPNRTATEKIPPQALEAEQSVLGAMLLSREAIDIAIENLSDDDFFKPAHAKIFKAITALYNSNTPADLLSVSSLLSKRKQLADVGGRAYLANLTDGTPGSANLEHHCSLVAEKSALNKMIEAANRVLAKVYDQSTDVEDLIEDTEQRIFAIKERKLKKSAVIIGDHIQDSLSMLEAGASGTITGIPSGLGGGNSPLDRLTSGFQPADFIVIGARPSVGKTALAMEIVEYNSVDRNAPVLVFSLEMSARQLSFRTLCSRARVSSDRARNNRLRDDDWTRLSIAAGNISESPIYIDDSPSLGYLEMRAKARRAKSQHDIKLIVIDYLQLMAQPRRAESREHGIDINSQAIKAMAKELDVPVIVLSQLNRQMELRGKDARPQLSDLRESGAIENHADLIMFIHRPRDEEGHWGKEGEIILAKQRNGPTGNIDIVFVKEYARFELKEIHERQEPDIFRGEVD